MKTHPMKLVTLICESMLQDQVTRCILETGASGYTVFEVGGTGASGLRPADIEESSNIQIEVIANPEIAGKLLERLHRDFFTDYALVVYESDVRVLRPAKF